MATEPEPAGHPLFSTALAHHAADPFRLLVESVRDYAIFMLDPAGAVISWNPGAERIYGYARGDILGRSASVLHRPEDVEAGHLTHALRATLAEGRFEEEAIRVRKDGSEFWAVVTLTDLQDHFGRHVGFAKVTRDITERRLAEARLRESEERHRRLLDVMPDAVFVTVGDLVAFCNPALARMVGAVGPEGLIGRPVLSMFHPDYHEPIIERIGQLRARGGTVPPLEEEIVMEDGRSVPVEVTATAIAFRGESAILVVLHDLTARKQLEERFRLFVESVKEYAIFLTDPCGTIISWNVGGEAIFGYPAAEAVGMPYARLFPPEEAARDDPGHELREAAATGRAVREGWRVRKDGTRLWINGVLTALRDRRGHLRGYAKVARDLTERRASAEALRAIVETAFDAIITIDEAATIRTFNRRAEELFGYRAEEVVGRNLNVLMPEPYRSEHVDYVARYLRTGQAKIIGVGRQVDCLRKDGTTFPADLAVTEFRVDERRMFTGMIRDMTDRRKLEEQLRQAQKLEAVGRLAGGVAHDFNNLLTVISGYSEILLAMIPPDDPNREAIRAISEAGERAAGLTRQLLAFSRKTVLAPEVLDLNAVVTDTAQMLRRMIGEDVTLTTVLDPMIPPVRLDPSHLGQVLMNLAVNARDAMPTGGKLTVETRLVILDGDSAARSEIPPGNYVRLTVSDTGYGMTPEVQARAFEPFFTTKPAGQGTGLGLAVVHGIVKQSGGHIEVSSEPGRGTAFRLYFPPAEPADAAKAHHPEEARSGHETILLVEDEDGVRGLAQLVLQTHGYRVLATATGREALRAAETHPGPIHLLITDVVMPGVGGRELAEALRARLPQLRVLFLRGYTDDAVIRHGVVSEQVAFLQKPFSSHGLARKVREVLDAAGGSP